MDTSDAGRSAQSLFFFMGLLCLAITAHILGAPISFLDINGSENLVESTHQEGFSVASTCSLDRGVLSHNTSLIIQYQSSSRHAASSTSLGHPILLACTLYRPPIFHV